MKIMTQREFDSKYQDLRDWPLETLYIVYRDMALEVQEELDKLKLEIDQLKDE